MPVPPAGAKPALPNRGKLLAMTSRNPGHNLERESERVQKALARLKRANAALEATLPALIEAFRYAHPGRKHRKRGESRRRVK